MPVLSELEAAILSDPDDVASYAVYADYLTEAGDPRGELIATQLAAASGDPELQRAALRVFAKHRDAFLGKLDSMIAAHALTWRAGFIHAAALSTEVLLVEDGVRVAASLAEVATALLAHPSGRFLASLVVHTIGRVPYGGLRDSQRDIVAAIVAARPRALRRLQLGDLQYGIPHVGPIEALSELPALRELVVHGQLSLGRLRFPELRTISLEPQPLRRRGGRELALAEWPKLQSLHLHLRDHPDHVERDLVQLVERTDMPALEHLALLGLRDSDAVVAALVGSPMLAQLRRLELSQLGERARRVLRRHAGAFQHLEIVLPT